MQATPKDLAPFIAAKAKQDAADHKNGIPITDALRGSTDPASKVAGWAHVVKGIGSAKR